MRTSSSAAGSIRSCGSDVRIGAKNLANVINSSSPQTARSVAESDAESFRRASLGPMLGLEQAASLSASGSRRSSLLTSNSKPGSSISTSSTSSRALVKKTKYRSEDGKVEDVVKESKSAKSYSGFAASSTADMVKKDKTESECTVSTCDTHSDTGNTKRGRSLKCIHEAPANTQVLEAGVPSHKSRHFEEGVDFDGPREPHPINAESVDSPLHHLSHVYFKRYADKKDKTNIHPSAFLERAYDPDSKLGLANLESADEPWGLPLTRVAAENRNFKQKLCSIAAGNKNVESKRSPWYNVDRVPCKESKTSHKDLTVRKTNHEANITPCATRSTPDLCKVQGHGNGSSTDRSSRLTSCDDLSTNPVDDCPKFDGKSETKEEFSAYTKEQRRRAKGCKSIAEAHRESKDCPWHWECALEGRSWAREQHPAFSFKDQRSARQQKTNDYRYESVDGPWGWPSFCNPHDPWVSGEVKHQRKMEGNSAMKEQFQGYSREDILNAHEKCGNPSVEESADGPWSGAGKSKFEGTSWAREQHQLFSTEDMRNAKPNKNYDKNSESAAGPWAHIKSSTKMESSSATREQFKGYTVKEFQEARQANELDARNESLDGPWGPPPAKVDQTSPDYSKVLGNPVEVFRKRKEFGRGESETKQQFKHYSPQERQMALQNPAGFIDRPSSPSKKFEGVPEKAFHHRHFSAEDRASARPRTLKESDFRKRDEFPLDFTHYTIDPASGAAHIEKSAGRTEPKKNDYQEYSAQDRKDARACKIRDSLQTASCESKDGPWGWPSPGKPEAPWHKTNDAQKFDGVSEAKAQIQRFTPEDAAQARPVPHMKSKTQESADSTWALSTHGQKIVVQPQFAGGSVSKEHHSRKVKDDTIHSAGVPSKEKDGRKTMMMMTMKDDKPVPKFEGQSATKDAYGGYTSAETKKARPSKHDHDAFESADGIWGFPAKLRGKGGE